jgi:predicted TIM-barrel fold metal-dependent hydrolase
MRNFYFTSIEDRFVFDNWDDLPVDHVMMECDYPHSDGNWPNLQDIIKSELKHFSVVDRERMCFANAAALYRHPLPSPSWLSSLETRS